MLKRCLAASCCFVFLSAGLASAGAIHYAATRGDLGKIQAIVKSNPKLLNDPDSDGATPLHWAAAGGQAPVVEFLLANKANVGAKKKDGVTPLHVAVALNKIEVVKMLLASKANPNAADKKGRTPISIAEAGGNRELIELLNSAPKAAPTAPKPAVKPVVANKPSVQPATGTDISSLAQGFVQLVARNDFAAATGNFAPVMKEHMPAEKLSQTWRLITMQAGQFKRIVTTRTDKIQGDDVVFVTCEFDKSQMDAKVVFNSQKQIAGLWIVPTKQ
jgi:ankyrin repeat protein